MPRHHLWVRFLKGVIMCVIIFLIFLGVLAFSLFTGHLANFLK